MEKGGMEKWRGYDNQNNIRFEIEYFNGNIRDFIN